MSTGSHARPSGPRHPGRRPPGWRGRLWRIGTPLVVVACGTLFVVSATSSQGTDLRPGRYTDLASLVASEARSYDALRARVRTLDAEVNQLSTALQDDEVRRFQGKIQRLKDPAGLVARQGPGVSVTLSDAPADVINSTTGNINPLLVHQQDIQAVVNALWKGGATAVTVQGQRIVSTTGIKCEGNAVQLQGRPFPQPYVIQAVGDQAELLAAIDGDSYVQAYREDADDPTISVGWDLQLEDLVTAPAYDGLLDLNYATPLRGSES